MEHQSRNAATLSRKATQLLELEGNERRVKAKKGKAEEKGKTSEEEQTEKVNQRRPFGRAPVEVLCALCESTDHWACACPHNWSLRPGAVLGPGALILCVCCGDEDPQLTHDGEPGVDYPARAIRRPKFYPTIEEKRAMKVASDNAARASSKGPELDPKLIAAAAAGAAAAAADILSDVDDYSNGKPKPWGYDLY